MWKVAGCYDCVHYLGQFFFTIRIALGIFIPQIHSRDLLKRHPAVARMQNLLQLCS